MKIIMENKSPSQELGMYWLGTKKGPAGAAHVVGTGGGRATFLDWLLVWSLLYCRF